MVSLVLWSGFEGGTGIFGIFGIGEFLKLSCKGAELIRWVQGVFRKIGKFNNTPI